MPEVATGQVAAGEVGLGHVHPGEGHPVRVQADLHAVEDAGPVQATRGEARSLRGLDVKAETQPVIRNMVAWQDHHIPEIVVARGEARVRTAQDEGAVPGRKRPEVVAR